MKKRLWSCILTLCMAISFIPTTALATNATASSDPVELGTLAEYQNVLDTTYDENGLRTAKVGYFIKGGMLGEKYGIMNEYGNWVAQPIYDEIKVRAHEMRIYSYEKGGSAGARVPVTPVVFIGGYTQAVRNGKMGLLNSLGEEVIPCQYDFVQMPSEGVAAVYNFKTKDTSGQSRHTYYLGYWSLEENRELIAPKYVTSHAGDCIGSASNSLNEVRVKPAGDFNQIHDFMDGYALVFTGKDSAGHTLANIIDKTGKEVLPKSYPILLGGNYATYNQKSSYLSFLGAIDVSDYRFTKLNNEWGPEKNAKLTTQTTAFGTGLVSPAGVQIQPIYTTGVLASPGEASFFINSATFQIYPEDNLVITMMDAQVGFLYGGAETVLDLKGKTKVAPSAEDASATIDYDPQSKVISNFKAAYKSTGEKLASYDAGSFVVNGGVFGRTYGKWVPTPDGNGYDPTTVYAVDANGTKLNLTQRMNWSLQVDYNNDPVQQNSDFSIGGLFWVRNNEKKWGLMDIAGKEILPFVYDDVDYGSWSDKDLPFAVVTQNGKQGLVGPKGEILTPVEYSEFRKTGAHTSTVAKKDGKFGLIDLKTGKVTLPVKYDGIGAFSGYNQLNADYFAMGTCVATKGNDTVFVDRQGNEVYTRTHSESEKHLNFSNEATGGLYSVYEGQMDNRGRIVIPKTDRADATIDYQSSDVIYIKDGNVYRTKANHLPRNYTPKAYAPATATAAPSATKLMVNGKSVAVDAYAIAGNNYMKLRDLATMVSGTSKNFEVTWDNAKAAINLVSGKAYTAVGGEMAKGDGQSKAAKRTASKIFLNGGEVALTAYIIGGNNYFKLRDVMQAFDIGVGYDNATATATVNTDQSYTLAGDALKYQQADAKAYEAAGGKLNADGTVEQTKLYDAPFAQAVQTPKKLEYYVGDAFDSTGFKGNYVDVYGNGTDVSDKFTFNVNGTAIYNGYQFTTAGKKTVNCVYEGELINTFVVNVYEKQTEKDLPLADGDYYIMLMGKYVTAINGKWMELRTEKPEAPFTIKHLGVDMETGHHLYHVIYNNTTVYYYGNGNGAQLISGGGLGQPHEWRIAKYSDFWTMRDEKNQAMAVNASGASSADGTKVTIWTYKGSAPEHAKIQFIPAN